MTEGWRSVFPEKAIALSQVTDKLQYIKLYQVSHSTGRDCTHYFRGDIVVVRDAEVYYNVNDHYLTSFFTCLTIHVLKYDVNNYSVSLLFRRYMIKDISNNIK